eukprot:COSAG04_NODE_9082_length_901_cov_0.834165_2_plen_169_part_01
MLAALSHALQNVHGEDDQTSATFTMFERCMQWRIGKEAAGEDPTPAYDDDDEPACLGEIDAQRHYVYGRKLGEYGLDHDPWSYEDVDPYAAEPMPIYPGGYEEMVRTDFSRTGIVEKDDKEGDDGKPDYSKLKVAELKELLSGRSLENKGRKADLIKRLQEHDDEQEEE